MNNDVASTSTLQLVPPPSPPWLELPDDVTAKILHKLGTFGLLCAAQYRNKEVLCRLAVDLSQGQVMAINIVKFRSDDLLEYIGERCGNLRCLRLLYCGDVSGRSLRKAVKGFPLLDVLHLQCTYVEKEDIEAIGKSCPMLKTFAMNGREGGEEALAVATSMPELCYLQLFRNAMTNDTLKAILDGCPKLEVLDVRHCFNLHLSGELGKRCARQIEIVHHPDDPTHDYKWYAMDNKLDYDDEFDHDIDSDMDPDHDY